MELSERILHYLNENEKVDTLKLASEFNEDHQKIVGAVKSLEALEMVCSEPTKSSKWELTEEGQHVAEKGSHEAVLYRSVPAEGIAQAQLMKVGVNKCIHLNIPITKTIYTHILLLLSIVLYLVNVFQKMTK